MVLGVQAMTRTHFALPSNTDSNERRSQEPGPKREQKASFSLVEMNRCSTNPPKPSSPFPKALKSSP